MKLCWNAIVKNEGGRILRAAESLAPWINSWVIVDTGSTDDTKQKLVDFFRDKGIPGEIRDEPFEDWSQARNSALSWARKLRFAYEWDYLMLVDADMELVVKDKDWLSRINGGASYDMYQVTGVCHYQNRRFLNANPYFYRGVTHEYLDAPSAGLIEQDKAFFLDHADGANRPDKFKRDIRLLKKGLKLEPGNERYFYYLAGSYRDAGNHFKAAEWFRRRVEAGGWDEEVWHAQYQLAHELHAIGDDAEFIRNLLIAYNMRPSRAEPMYDLAHHYRMLPNSQPAALACAEAVEHLPKPKDALFVNDFVYQSGIKSEISICSFYVPGKREKGFKVTEQLAIQPGPYESARAEARANLYHYLEPLVKFCPSFDWKMMTPPIEEDGWTAMNPSITLHKGGMVCNVRCVNYRIDERGAYMIRGTDGTANRENPINTRNVLVRIDSHLNCGIPIAELLPRGNAPVEFPLVVGFEDVRLNSVDDELIGSATVRQFHPDGNCEQAVMEIMPTGEFDYQRMLREPRETEKNWAPIQGQREWMWRPGITIGETGRFIHHNPPDITYGHISGGSQLIPFKRGWLSVVHEAFPLPGESYKRFYCHRFAYYNEAFSLVQLSPPFVFHERVIEFCAGMCYNPSHTDQLVLSYGFKDESARLGLVQAAEVEKFLWLHS